MKHCLAAIVFTLLLVPFATDTALSLPRGESRVVEGMIVVKLHDAVHVPHAALRTGVPSIDQKIAEHQVYAIERVFPYLEHSALSKASELAKFYYFRYGSGDNEAAVARTFAADPNIEYAEPKHLAHLLDTPDDPLYPTMTQFPHVQAPAAWDIIKGEAGDIIIAIVDNGTVWDHEDLLANVWTNPGEIPDNGEDDDGNGFIDDVHGWNFPFNHNDPSPAPGVSHGTWTAGIAAASTDNALGVASISWNCTHMPINAWSTADWDQSAMEYGYEAIVYAAANGADIISNSWGMYDPSRFGQEVIDFAHANGALLVAAAGNDSYNFDRTPIYPAGYDHVLSVGATYRDNDVKPPYSNYGVTVDVFAPSHVRSTSPNGGYEDYLWGTSFAAPMVAGLAGLVKTLHPSWTNEQVREQVRVTCDSIDEANPACAGLLGKGRINALRAVSEEGNPSIRIADFLFTESGGDGIINAADTVDVTVDFVNYLAGVSDIAVSLVVDDPLITVIVGDGVIPILNTDDIASVPFQFAVDPTAPDGYVLSLITDIGAGSYTDRDLFLLTVNPLEVVTHSTSLVEMSVTTQGNIGWTDFAGSGGVGFVHAGENRLYEGGVMIGAGAEQVSDCIRGTQPGLQDDDLRAISELIWIEPAGLFRQSSTVDLDDSLAANPIGVWVNQYTVAGIVGVPPADGAISIRYEIANGGHPPMTDLHLGVFCDWNVNPDCMDYVRLDPERRLGYVQDRAADPTKLVAVKLLTRDIGWSYRSVDNANELDDGFTEAEKWSFLSGGVQTQQLDDTDVSTLIAAGPFDVDAFGRVVVGFSLIGASSLAELLTTADVVQAVWDQWYPASIEEDGRTTAAEVSLLQSYPNPTFASASIRFSLDRHEAVRLVIYDDQGRVLRRLINGSRGVGIQTVVWDGLDGAGRAVPSGNYFYRLDAGSKSATRKLILLR